MRDLVHRGCLEANDEPLGGLKEEGVIQREKGSRR